MRAPRVIGRRRKVLVSELRVGMMLLDHVHGYGGKILMQEGEILSQKHIDQIAKWDARDGIGKLSLYTRSVWCQLTDASGDERPACDLDPYAAVSIQKNYRTGMNIPKFRHIRPTSTKRVYKMVEGNLAEIAQ